VSTSLSRTPNLPDRRGRDDFDSRQIFAGEIVPKRITLKSKAYIEGNIKQGGEVLP
jgi:hypothetical protein